ncbi:exopolyphosphatase [Shewanella sp. WXL01]|uniref:Exopolyphosphatase n=1 Tax=Shewanella maritima TaxID=2520507 RepID=A0A411PJ08_9GAMM|nr:MULTISPECIES: exopolyphosphatase [Shewanella]NKF51258.1 exopolyphosphatase [Shewanella sp. WXL01]QBF83569.1 exopolyphosphatase [Shewanella maritima]
MSSELYAAITLGSNSFNMLVAQTIDAKPTIIAKYKQKVRLAEGINADGALSADVMQRGLDCLAMFTQKANEHQIKAANVAVLATATLRSINNADEFDTKAKPIFPFAIEIITGQREAELIYQGMTATTKVQGRCLVIDIGGASTEFIVGEDKHVLFKTSVAMGGVRFNQSIFTEQPYALAHFEQAKEAVRLALGDELSAIRELGWQQVLGASGAVQTLMTLQRNRGNAELIDSALLEQVRDEVIAQGKHDIAQIEGVDAEQAPTLAAGVAILLALFELLDIKQLDLAGGALREGVLQMLADRVS